MRLASVVEGSLVIFVEVGTLESFVGVLDGERDFDLDVGMGDRCSSAVLNEDFFNFLYFFLLRFAFVLPFAL